MAFVVVLVTHGAKKHLPSDAPSSETGLVVQFPRLGPQSRAPPREVPCWNRNSLLVVGGRTLAAAFGSITDGARQWESDRCSKREPSASAGSIAVLARPH